MRLFCYGNCAANLGDTIMTTKLKATKTEVQQATADVIALAAEAGDMASGISSICDAVSAITRDLHFRAVKVGRFSFTNPDKCCPIAAAFIQHRFPYADAVSDSTVSFTLSCFRKAVETGDDYTENPSRKAKQAKQAAADKAASEAPAAKQDKTSAETGEAETEQADENDGTIVVAIKKKATLKQAASAIRKLAEAMRGSDGLNLLAAMLVDVVNEIDEA